MPIFLGNNIIRLNEVDSTNNFAQQLLNTTNVFDGTVIVAKKQFAGRGQRGKTWNTEPDANLLFSIILKDAKTSIENQFYLNMAIALGLHEYLSKIFTAQHNIQIKWPNDILVNAKKIAGILIENSISGNAISNSIIGIGLNVNQQQFIVNDGARDATSISLCLEKNVDLEECLQIILSSLEKYILLFRNQKFEQITTAYHENLYQKDISANYNFNGEMIIATIKKVDTKGLLILETEAGKTIECNLQEIKFLN